VDLLLLSLNKRNRNLQYNCHKAKIIYTIIYTITCLVSACSNGKRRETLGQREYSFYLLFSTTTRSIKAFTKIANSYQGYIHHKEKYQCLPRHLNGKTSPLQTRDDQDISCIYKNQTSISFKPHYFYFSWSLLVSFTVVFES